jgi:hypothetical protein
MIKTMIYSLFRLASLTLFLMALWNLHLLRLLNNWSAIDLWHILFSVCGVFIMAILLNRESQKIWLRIGVNEKYEFSAIFRAVNLIFLTFILAVALDDLFVVVRFFDAMFKNEGATISESAEIARDVATFRLFAFLIFAVYLVVGFMRVKAEDKIDG